MTLCLNLSKLLEEGKIDKSEFKRYLNLSKENVPDYTSDSVIGVGLIVISYGFMGFYIDLPESGTIAGLFIGLAHLGLGFLLKSNRVLLATICFVSVGLGIFSSILGLIYKGVMALNSF